MLMMVFWEDLNEAVTKLLGFSQRIAKAAAGTPGPSVLHRQLPWQHPYWNQLFVKRISKVEGIRLQGNSISNPVDLFSPARGGVGSGYQTNNGPWTEFYYALLTVTFWRPPYYVLTDAAITDLNNKQQEWLRYTNVTWEIDGTMLSREGTTYLFSPGQSLSNGLQFAGSVGQQIMKGNIKIHWYELPQAAIFETLPNGYPIGLPINLLNMRTPTTNPITAYPSTGGVNPTTFTATGSALTFTVNSPRGGGVDDSNPAKRFFGFPMGTLAYTKLHLQPRELQLPPYLMLIPQIAGNVAIAQQQYDVILDMKFFDPPRAPAISSNAALVPSGSGASIMEAFRGHNLMPNAGDGMWYAVQSKGNVNGTNRPTTPFQYGDHHDLFQII